MQALDYWKAVTADQSGFLDRLLAVLRDSGVRYCIIGGQGGKRQKDLADISRLLEAHPQLRPQVPREILERLV